MYINLSIFLYLLDKISLSLIIMIIFPFQNKYLYENKTPYNFLLYGVINITKSCE